MRPRPGALGALAVVLALTASAATPAPAQEPPQITIAATANDSTTSGLYAVAAGLFKKAGLNVKLVTMTSGSAVAAAVAGGAVQIGNSSLLSVIEARARHIPFTLVGTSAMFDDAVAPYAGIIVRKDSPIRTARDLDGKTIAVSGLKDLAAVASWAWIDRNGGDSASGHYVEMPVSASLAAVERGSVDATFLTTPLLSQGLDDGTIRVLVDPLNAISHRYLLLAWITTEDYAAKNPDIIARFARVMHDAAVYCNAHHGATVGMVAQFAKLDESVVRNMPRAMFAPYLTAGLIQPLVNVAVKYKLIDSPFNAQELISPYALKPGSR